MPDRDRVRLTIVATHPTQYQAPWLRYLAAHRPELDVTVVYASRPTSDQQGVGFAHAFEWDTPLLDGYRFQIVRAAVPGAVFDSSSFRGLDVPELTASVLATHPDVVLSPGWHSITLLRATMACRRRGIPVLYRGDTHLASAPRGWRRPAWTVKTRAMLRLYSAHLAVGVRSREYLLAHGVRPTAIYASPHAVDNDRFQAAAAPSLTGTGRAASRAEYGCDPDDFAVLFVGKLTPGKRVIDAVRALAALGPKAVLLVAGSGESEREAHLEAERLKVRVRWLGFVNQRAIAALYAAADCLVVPSESESWGLVVNEAMATGLPAVVTDAVGCAPDLIIPGETGELFRAGDIAGLASALERVRQRGGRTRMAAFCRDRVSSYTFERASVGLSAACDAVVRRPRGASVRVIACCGGMVVVSGLERMTFEVLRVIRDRHGSVHCIVNSWGHRRIVALAEAIGAGWSIGLYYHEFSRRTVNPVRHVRALWDILRTSGGLLRDALRFRPTHVLVPDHGVVIRNAPALMLLRLAGVEVVFRVANAPEDGRFYEWLWRRVVAPIPTLLVANSLFAKKRLEQVSVPPRKIVLIQNAVSRRPSASSCDRDVIELARSRRTLLVVGQVAPFKGTHLVVDLGLQMLHEYPDLQIVVVGALPVPPDDLVEYAGELQARVAESRLAERIRFVGGRQNVLDIMRASYLLVAPILQEETFGNVVLEAKSVGLPGVVFPKGGLVELVSHRDTGFICRDDSLDALAEGVTFFVNDPAARERASRRCLAVTNDPASEYSFARFEQRWLDVFHFDRPRRGRNRQAVAVEESPA